MDQQVTTRTASIVQQVKEKLKLGVLAPVFFIAVGVGFVAVGGYLAVSTLMPKLPQPIVLKEGEYVRGEVLVKFKPRAKPDAVIKKILSKTQTVYRNTQSGKIVGKFDPEVKNNPKQYTAQTLRLTPKRTARVFSTSKISDDVKKEISHRSGVIRDPEKIAADIGLDRWYIIQVNEQTADVAALIQGFRADKRNVETAEADGIGSPQFVETQPQPIEIPDTDVGGDGVVPFPLAPAPRLGAGVVSSGPNDPYYNSQTVLAPLRDQWGLDAVRAESAWAVTTGNRNVIIAVPDSGVDYNHQDIKDKIWLNIGEDINHNSRADYWPATEQRNGVNGDLDNLDNDGNTYIDDLNGADVHTAVKYPGQPDTDGPLDTSGHGSWVTGISAATTNNNFGIAGMCQACTIMPLKIAGPKPEDPSIYQYSLLATGRAIDYARVKGAQVINTSSHSTVDYGIMRDAVTASIASGVTVVASAGDFPEPTTVHDDIYPAKYPGVIAVGSVDWDNNTFASNAASWLDVVGPGASIISLRARNPATGAPFPDSDTSRVDDQFIKFSGTPASASLVAGVVGLMLSVNPALGPDEVNNILQTTAKDIWVPGRDDETGYGLIDAGAAVLKAASTEYQLDFSILDAKSTALDAATVRVEFVVGKSSQLKPRNVGYAVVNTANESVPLHEGMIDRFDFSTATVTADFPLASLPPVIKITIDPQNQFPELSENNNSRILKPAQPQVRGVGEQRIQPNQPMQIDVSASQINNHPLTYTAPNRLTGATFSNQRFSWTPTAINVYRQAFLATDTVNNLVGGTLATISVNDPNAPQLQLPYLVSVDRGKNLVLNVSATDPTDPSSANLTYSARNLPLQGSDYAAYFSGQTFSWRTPDTDGCYNVFFKATNSVSQLSEERFVTISVGKGCNTQASGYEPVIPPLDNQLAVVGQALAFDVPVTDPFEGPITLDVAEGLPAGATLTNGRFSWAPQANNVGVWKLTFTAENIFGFKTFQTATITVVPAGSPSDLRFTSLHAERQMDNSIQVRMRVDNDYYGTANNILVRTKTPSGATVHEETITSLAFGEYTSREFTIQQLDPSVTKLINVIDPDNTIHEFTRSNNTADVAVIRVNTAPTIAAIPAQTVNEGDLLTFTVSASDAENDPLVFSVYGEKTGTVGAYYGWYYGMSINQSGVFRWIPACDQAGTFDVRPVVSDVVAGNNKVTGVSFNATVVDRPCSRPDLKITQAQVLADDAGDGTVTMKAVIENVGSVTMPNTVPYRISDVQNQYLGSTFSIDGSIPALPAGGRFEIVRTISRSSTGQYMLMADPENSLAEAAEGNNTIFTSSISNQPNVFNPLPAQTVAEGQTLTFQPTFTNATVNGYFVYPNSLVHSAIIMPAGATYSNRTFSWTPGYDQEGTYEVTLIGRGYYHEGYISVPITVTHTNVAPVFVPVSSRKAYPGSQVIIHLRADDFDGETVTYGVSGPLPSGAFLVPSTGLFEWNIPNSYPIGYRGFIFQADDGHGGIDSMTVVVNVVSPLSGGGGGGGFFGGDPCNISEPERPPGCEAEENL